MVVIYSFKNFDFKGAFMVEEYKEYATFVVNAMDGTEVELAIVDEFEYENKFYVVGAKVVGDTIVQEGLYIYKAKIVDDELKVEKIKNEVDYKRIAQAYIEMDEE